MDDKYQEIQPEEINGANRGTLMDTLGIRFTHLSPAGQKP